MDFALSPDQTAFLDSLGRTLDRILPLARLRAIAEQDAPHAADVDQALTELGLPAMLVPEAFGGLGLGVLDAALACEALGHATAPYPFIASALAALALTESGNEALQTLWLPRIAAGEARVGLAISEASSGARLNGGVRATGGTLTGRSLFVLDASLADAFLVADSTGALHLVAGDAKGLTRTALATIDRTRSLGELEFDQTPAARLSSDPKLLRRVTEVGRCLIAADTLGAAQGMLDRAVDYAKTRRQFGRIIGSFQAVKHLCAEMAARLEPCRSLVWYAAYAQDALPEERALTAAHAKAHLAEVGQFVARTSTEVFGGIGITDLLGLHYGFKRIGLNRQLLGAPERARRDAAAAQGFVAEGFVTPAEV
jgi:alkylation response protein AidB-like acyl-CoA dehydrogenase